MFTLPELPYAYNALEPSIDEMTMRIHHDKHHAAYVKNLNDALAGQDAFLEAPVEAVLRRLGELPESIRMKVRNNGGGHANHTLFWQSMNPKGGGEPDGALGAAIVKAFGSVAGFRDQLSAAAMGRFGSGWAWLVIDSGKLAITDTPNQDSPLLSGQEPILGIDVWEHAYYLKYQNLRAEYVKNWWNVVDWPAVAKRYATPRT